MYFDSSGDLRRGNYKGKYMEQIFALRHLPKFKKSFDFISNALSQYSDELFYIPSNIDSIIDVDVLATEEEISSYSGNIVVYQVIETITIHGRDITSKMASICQTGTNSLYIKNTLSSLLLIPISLININENIKIIKLAFREDMNK